MESLAASLLPPDVSQLAAVGLVALALATSALTAAAGIGGGLVLISVMASFLPPIVVIPIHGVVQLLSNSSRGLLLVRHVVWPLFALYVPLQIVGVLVAVEL